MASENQDRNPRVETMRELIDTLKRMQTVHKQLFRTVTKSETKQVGTETVTGPNYMTWKNEISREKPVYETTEWTEEDCTNPQRATELQ